MPTPNELRSELRGLIHAEQDHNARWRALTALLDTWPAELIKTHALPYLEGALREDTSSRAASSHWLTFSGPNIEVHAAWPIVRAWRQDGDERPISTKQAIALAKSPHLAHLTTLNLTHNRINITTRKALANTPPPPPHQALERTMAAGETPAAIALL